MSEMAIGSFSRACGLTVGALRHYDDLGLLRPIRVASRTGYRYYGSEQVVPARIIARLRSLDVPLDEIRSALADPGHDAVRARLRANRASLEARTWQLQRTMHHLQQIIEDKEDLMSKAVSLVLDPEEERSLASSCSMTSGRCSNGPTARPMTTTPCCTRLMRRVTTGAGSACQSTLCAASGSARGRTRCWVGLSRPPITGGVAWSSANGMRSAALIAVSPTKRSAALPRLPVIRLRPGDWPTSPEKRRLTSKKTKTASCSSMIWPACNLLTCCSRGRLPLSMAAVRSAQPLRPALLARGRRSSLRAAPLPSSRR